MQEDFIITYLFIHAITLTFHEGRKDFILTYLFIHAITLTFHEGHFASHWLFGHGHLQSTC